jgi:hypothetical protein
MKVMITEDWAGLREEQFGCEHAVLAQSSRSHNGRLWNDRLWREAVVRSSDVP